MNTLHSKISPMFLERSTWYVLDEPTESTNSTVTVTSVGKLLREINHIWLYIMPPLLLGFGTFGNVMTVLVMRGMRASQSTACLAIYFTALAVSDQCYLSTALVFYWVKKSFHWPSSFFRYNIFCYLPKFIWNVAGITSAWFLIAMTYQRVTSVVTPHRVGVLCTVRRGKIVVAIITFVGCAFNVHFLFTWIYYPEYGDCQFRQKYEYLIGYFEWQDMLCVSVFPFILLVIGNSVLIWHVIQSMQLSRKMRGNMDQQSPGSGQVYSMSITLIITSAAFLLFTLPDTIFDVYLEMSYIKLLDDDFGAMVSLLQTMCATLLMNSVASNFYLYLLTGRKFREEAKRYLCCQGADQECVSVTHVTAAHLSKTSASCSG